MRKPRDFDAELKALNDKTQALRDAKLKRLGELVIATGADTLDIETLAGGLLAIVETRDAAQRGAWCKAGEAMFRKGKREPKGATVPAAPGVAAGHGSKAPA